MHSFNAVAIMKAQLKEKCSEPDGCDDHDSERAKKCSSIGIQNDESEYPTEQAGGENCSAARTRGGLGDGVGSVGYFRQGSSDAAPLYPYFAFGCEYSGKVV